jgi:mono/diheme cytochrome c family protein
MSDRHIRSAYLALSQTMKSILCLSLMVLMSSAYAAALPGDSAEGKRLHDANCIGCHDTGIYTRKDRLVQSLDALKKRLGDCSHMANKEVSAIETQNLLKYLNEQFYRFP